TLQAASPGPGGEQRIKRLEARGGVVVTQKDQTATGELGIFDMKANTVTLTGNPVIMTQGQNVLRGGKLVVDLTSGVSRVEAGKSGQGVKMLVQPSASVPDSKGGSADGPAPRPIPVRGSPVKFFSLFRRKSSPARRTMTPVEARARQAAIANAQADVAHQTHRSPPQTRPRHDGESRPAARHAYLAAHG